MAAQDDMEMPSSPPGPVSKFTTRHLSQMANYTTTCPLRIVAHIDLDAFYAQCEMVRLNLPRDKPLAVRQWHGLIAINYPARAFGVKRLTTVPEARKLCPDITFQHVATWREGDTKWAYRPDAAKHVASDKVSLDPYRLQSRRIMALVTSFLPQGSLQRVEKASIDEVFMDLSAQIQQELLQEYPELKIALESGKEEQLPLPEGVALDWADDEVIPLSEDEEQLPIDWDDVALCIAARIVRKLRQKIYNDLQYTCSGGVSVNKLISKLGSGHKKPNAQTVVRSRAMGVFLAGLKFTKIRNLGGKLGERVASAFQTEEVSQILQVPLPQLNARLGPETGTWVYNTVRGVDTSEVMPRTQIKTMLSAKQFRPAIGSRAQATSWFRIFSADIFARMIDTGVIENKLRPKTLTLHYTGQRGSKSKGVPIPRAKPLSEEMLVQACEAALSSLLEDGYTWPCEHLSASVSGFEESVTGNMGISGFLVKRPPPSIASTAPRGKEGQASDDEQKDGEQVTKKRRLESDTKSITNFFSKAKQPVEAEGKQLSGVEKQDVFTGPADTTPSHIGPIDHFLVSSPAHPNLGVSASAVDTENLHAIHDEGAAENHSHEPDSAPADPRLATQPRILLDNTPRDQERTASCPAYDDGIANIAAAPAPQTARANRLDEPFPSHQTNHEPLFFCPRCKDVPFGSESELTSHTDWHFAMELQEAEQQQQQQRGTPEHAQRSTARSGPGPGPASSSTSSRGGRRSNKRGGGKREAGQRTLDFS